MMHSLLPSRFGLGVHAVPSRCRPDGLEMKLVALWPRASMAIASSVMDHLLARGQTAVQSRAPAGCGVEAGGETLRLVGGLAMADDGNHLVPYLLLRNELFATIWDARSGRATDMPQTLLRLATWCSFLVRLNPIGCPLYQTVASSPINPLTDFLHGKTKTNAVARMVARNRADHAGDI